MQAVGYFRETASSSLSVESHAFLDFCHANGFEAAATFIDTEGSDGPQSGYRQLLEYVRQQPRRGFTVVAVASFHGLGADGTEIARRYYQLASLGARVVMLDGGKDMGASLLTDWASSRNKDGISQRVRAGMRRKAVKGEVLGRPPYGYKVGPHRRLQIMPEEGTIVRLIFRLYLKDGLGIRRIANRLNQDGIKTRRDGAWSMVTVRDILRNRAYVGTYQRFGVRVPASHPPLILSEDFQRVQDRMDQRRPANLQRESLPFLLSGLICCGNCSNRMSGVTRKQSWLRKSDGKRQAAQYRYYHCDSRSIQPTCAASTRRAAKVEEEVLRSLLSSLERGSPGMDKSEVDPLVEAESQIQRFRDKLRRLDRQLEKHLELAEAGRLSAERLQVAALRLAQEQLSTEEGLAQAVRIAQQQVSQVELKKQRAAAFHKLQIDWDRLTPLERQETLRQLVDKVIINGTEIELIVSS